MNKAHKNTPSRPLLLQVPDELQILFHMSETSTVFRAGRTLAYWHGMGNFDAFVIGFFGVSYKVCLHDERRM